MRKLIFLSALFISTSLFAQNDQTGAWYIYFGSIKPKDSKFSLDPEIQYRNHNFGGDLQQLLIRPIAKYQVLPNINLGLGYAYVLTEQAGDIDFPNRENRIHQEVILSQSAWRINFRHRFRYEQRFVEDKDFNTRYRYCLFVDVPLNKPEITNNTVYLALYNELFINGTKTDDTRNVFDRNRVYLGSGYRFSKDFAIQLGWMNQILENNSKGQIMLSLHHNLPISVAKRENQEPVRG